LVNYLLVLSTQDKEFPIIIRLGFRPISTNVLLIIILFQLVLSGCSRSSVQQSGEHPSLAPTQYASQNPFVAKVEATNRGFSAKNQRPDGAFPIPVPLDGSLQNPAWSPDGNSLVFTHFKNGYNLDPADLLVFDMNTLEIHTLVSDGTSNVNLPGSVWNEVTGKIVFASSRDPHDEIYVIAADGHPGQEQRITNFENQMAYEPAFSPDGKFIVFETHPLETEDQGMIVIRKSAGAHAPIPLTHSGEDCRQPNWSPAGNRIVFQCFADGLWNLWTISPDGTKRKQITSGNGDNTDASFSPDGKWVVYSSDQGNLASANLFIIPVSGGTPFQLTHSQSYDGAPSWSPDSRWIAFESSRNDPEESEGTQLWLTATPWLFVLLTSSP